MNKNWFKGLTLVELILVIIGVLLLVINSDVNLYKSIILLGLALIINSIKNLFN